MKIFVEVFGHTADLKSLNPSVAKWSKTISALENHSQQIEVTQEMDETVNTYIVIEGTKSESYYKEIRLKHPTCIMILVIVEMSSVNPRQHREIFRELFDIVFVPNKKLALNYDGLYFDFPICIQEFREVSYLNELERLNFGYVGTCKNSLEKSSLYYLRPFVLRKVSKIGKLKLAGKDWNVNLFVRLRNDFNYARFLISLGIMPHLGRIMFGGVRKNSLEYCGEVTSKFDFLNNCDVVLCLENDKYEFSEKVFDAIALGKVPLYVGSRLNDYDIPDEVLFYAGTSKREISKALKRLDASSVNQKLEQLNVWRKNGLTRWDCSNAFDTLGYLLSSYLNGHS